MILMYIQGWELRPDDFWGTIQGLDLEFQEVLWYITE